MSTARVLDDAALRRLGEQLGDPEVLCRFLRRYLCQLDPRIARLEQALSAGDQDDWMDAVLSLKTSSAMVGAQALAEQAAVLERHSAHALPSTSADPSAPGPEVPQSAAPITDLRRLAAETARQLQRFLQDVGAAH